MSASREIDPHVVRALARALTDVRQIESLTGTRVSTDDFLEIWRQHLIAQAPRQHAADQTAQRDLGREVE